MKPKWDQQYQSMLQDLQECHQSNQDFKTELECCFEISRRYWNNIENNLGDYRFSSEEEEIDFYRKVKPTFKSMSEYYNLLYQAELFKPSDRSSEIKEFWIREQQRLNRFIQNNSIFYQYYKTGDKSEDRRYFLRIDIDESAEYYDELLCTFLALEKYQSYIQSKLISL